MWIWGASHPPPQIHQNRPQAANPQWQASQYHLWATEGRGIHLPDLWQASQYHKWGGTHSAKVPARKGASQQPWTGTCDLSDKWQSVARNGTIDPNLKGQASNQVGGAVNCS